jgi:hypothetical protein
MVDDIALLVALELAAAGVLVLPQADRVSARTRPPLAVATRSEVRRVVRADMGSSLGLAHDDGAVHGGMDLACDGAGREQQYGSDCGRSESGHVR